MSERNEIRTARQTRWSVRRAYDGQIQVNVASGAISVSDYLTVADARRIAAHLIAHAEVIAGERADAAYQRHVVESMDKIADACGTGGAA
jgi:tRNA(Arg) A34 adenosine deaminase TadA